MNLFKFVLTGLALISVSGAVQANSEVRVVSTNYEPYNYQDIHGRPAGHASEMAQGLVTELKKHTEITVSDIEFYPWARSYYLAETTPNTLIFSIARTPEREDKFIWVGKLLPMPVYLYKNSARNDIGNNIQSNSLLWTVAGVNNGAPTICAENMGYKVVHKSSNYAIQFKMLLKGRVDLMVFDSVSFAREIRRHGYTESQFEPAVFLQQCSFDLYMALNKHSEQSVINLVEEAWQAVTETHLISELRDDFEKSVKPFH